MVPKKPPATVEFKDAVGEIGPNGLPRMVGGNPKGVKCGRLERNGVCNYVPPRASSAPPRVCVVPMRASCVL